MKNNDLYSALINQGNSLEEAKEMINEMIERVFEGENPEDVLQEFGLEPDYIFDILSY